jgi:hypothetical protein
MKSSSKSFLVLKKNCKKKTRIKNFFIELENLRTSLARHAAIKFFLSTTNNVIKVSEE